MHTTSKKKSDELYKNGFPKKISRNKYNLPLNERLKSVRLAKKMSAQRVVNELAQKGVSIGHTSLQGYEASEESVNHRYPSLPILIALADFYGCSMDYLFGITEKIERPRTRKIKPLVVRDLKTEINSSEKLVWEGKKISNKQRDLISAQIEFILTHNH
jgi:transcriptional regulator with XRE-family HTH domain